MTEDDICGHPTADDTPCQNPPSEGDHCWLQNHGGDVSVGRHREAPDKSTQEKIATVIEQGASISEACRRAGVHKETFYRWMQYGDEEDAGPFQEFRDRLVRARGESEATYRQALIEIATENDDTATLMAMLKQRHPDEWQDVNRGEQAGGNTVALYNEAPEDMDALIEALTGE